MKKLIIIALLLPLSLASQKYYYGEWSNEKAMYNDSSSRYVINERGAIKETHVDFTKQYISFVLHGMIEIDGHTFLNDTCKVPVKYSATLDGVTIKKGDTEYEHRECGIKGCGIIHLQVKREAIDKWKINIPDYKMINNLIYEEQIEN